MYHLLLPLLPVWTLRACMLVVSCTTPGPFVVSFAFLYMKKLQSSFMHDMVFVLSNNNKREARNTHTVKNLKYTQL